MKMTLLLLVILLSRLSYAYNDDETNPWTIDTAFGLSHFDNVNRNDGNTGVGRLALNYALWTDPFYQLSLETGIQSGNTMRLVLPKEAIESLGGVPIEAKIKPLLDGLIVVKTKPLGSLPILAWLKGGMVYRQLQVDSRAVNDNQEWTPELQAGLGYRITEQTIINLGVQYIVGKAPTITVNPLTESGVLSNIPTQTAILLGVSFSFL